MREDIKHTLPDEIRHEDSFVFASLFDESFQKVQFYFRIGDLENAEKHLAPLVLGVQKDSSLHEKMFESLNLLLLLYRERQKFQASQYIETFLEKELQKHCQTSPEKARYDFIKAQCKLDAKQPEEALVFFKKALVKALETKDTRLIYYISLGLAKSYAALEDTQKAYEELNNLSVFSQVLPLFDLEMESALLKSRILRSERKFVLASETLNSISQIVKKQKHYYYLAKFWFELALVSQENADVRKAFSSYKALEFLTDEKNYPELFSQIQGNLKTLNFYENENENKRYDLVLNISSQIAREQTKGELAFKNQHMLFDFLKLFVLNPNKVFSKQDLAQHIWQEDYEPKTHDNKIYVAIKRLRAILEPHEERPKYIFRSRKGYHLNSSVRVLVE